MTAPFSALTICGLDELESHSARGVTHVLSIIDPGTPDPAVFGRFALHKRLLLRFHDAIEAQPGVILPSRPDVETILGFGREVEREVGGVEGHLLIHCHMGISRSTAAMTMLLAQAHPDWSEANAVEHIRSIRSIAWPNLRMIAFADDLLGRQGRLVEAVGRLYSRSILANPDAAAAMAKLGRAEEVDLGRSYLG